MKIPSVLPFRVPSLVLVGIVLSCALRASGAPQVANFSEDAKDRHVGKILLPASPSKPITPGPTGVIKTSSTQSKAQLLLDSLKGSGGQSKAQSPVLAPTKANPEVKPEAKPEAKTEAKDVKSSQHKSEVKGAKVSESALNSASPTNALDKKASPALKDLSENGSPVKESQAKEAAEKETTLDKSKKSAASSQHARTRTTRNDGFIPPPPPVQPSMLMTGGMGELGAMPFTVDYMNKDELLQKQKDLELQLSDAKGQLKDTEEAGAEKKTRAERFDPLYKEGVVSRHELEAAQKEAADVDKEVERAKNRLTDLQNQSASVERKLKEIAKRTLPVSASPHKKTRK